MGRCGAPKRVRHLAEDLPDDLVHVIFSKLDFKSKVLAGQVCKKWDQLLKAPMAGARHWVVNYNLDTIVSSQALRTTEQVPIMESFKPTIGRWLISRVAAIKLVHVSATLFPDEDGAANMKVLESHLPLLAGCLTKHVNTLELTFQYGSPFASPLLSSSSFLTFLCPMVKKLSLVDLTTVITASQFAAICQLSSLEELFIVVEDDDAGLQEMTSDISKLVNLTTLELSGHLSLEYIPDSSTCLEKLEHLEICNCGPLRLPPSLKGLKSLASVVLTACSLETVPEVLTLLSTLTYLDLSDNDFGSSNSSDGWSWWPTALSRLTKLASLDISESHILSLPPHISGLRQLTKLCFHSNKLRSLPEQLSSLQNLRELTAFDNRFATFPVSVLSSLTALTSICFFYQQLERSATFKVSSSLLPILHPGLVELDLTHDDWDPLSLCHLGHAMVEVADRTPVPTLKFW